MTLRRLLPLAVLLTAGVGVFGQSAPPPMPVRPVIRFISPSPADLLLGETRIKIKVIGEQPEEVDFFVDGRKIDTVTDSPWQTFWEAGNTLRQHLITVALLRGGRQPRPCGHARWDSRLPQPFMPSASLRS